MPLFRSQNLSQFKRRNPTLPENDMFILCINAMFISFIFIHSFHSSSLSMIFDDDEPDDEYDETNHHTNNTTQHISLSRLFFFFFWRSSSLFHIPRTLNSFEHFKSAFVYVSKQTLFFLFHESSSLFCFLAVFFLLSSSLLWPVFFEKKNNHYVKHTLPPEITPRSNSGFSVIQCSLLCTHLSNLVLAHLFFVCAKLADRATFHFNYYLLDQSPQTLSLLLL